MYVGMVNAGKQFTVIVEDIVFPVMHNDIELRTFARKTNKPVTQYKLAVSRLTES